MSGFHPASAPLPPSGPGPHSPADRVLSSCAKLTLSVIYPEGEPMLMVVVWQCPRCGKTHEPPVEIKGYSHVCPKAPGGRPALVAFKRVAS